MNPYENIDWMLDGDNTTARFKKTNNMGLTRAEKHNQMLNRVFDHYQKHQEPIPPCHLYGRFLELAEEKLVVSASTF